MIDMDNFREVNERYGHSFGNVVLQEVSSRLRRLFPGGDVLIRVGGDEFLILAPGTEEAAAREQGRKIQEALQDICGQNMIRFRFSCSIGISLCPDDGEDFETLYRKGCRALLSAKRRELCKYVLYKDDPEIADEEMGPAADNTHIDSEDDGLDGLAREIFHVLYGAGPRDENLIRALELAGRRLGLGRVSIFAASENGERCRIPWEWCNEGVSHRKNAQAMTVGALGGWEQFDGDGMVFRPAAADGNTGRTPGEPGAGAVFRFIVRRRGKNWGWISFDDCLARREWTEEQRESLAFAAGILSVFLANMQGD